MSLEGLEFILNKREVVPTVSARDLLDRAEQVEADYKRHVRTYVPISRAAEGDGSGLNVEQFERRIIKSVKEARAPRGYLTAEYGYGKTSTALYLWNRAEEANLVVVPPFQMLHLPDLITATHGWVRYRLAHHRPELVARADELYDATASISIKKAAAESNANEATINQWVRDGRFILDLQAADYLHYFEAVTGLVQDAGFEGLIVLPDEIQQYIEPQLRSGGGDPIAPFFNVLQALATREGYLRFGFFLVIPLKEIGVIREARGRGDLLARMQELSLDLSTVYDQEFARRLWQKLAVEFDYADIASDIVSSETLDSLGEIASRDDLSNGPRTVINTFRRMVQRYKSLGHAKVQPYSPIDLVDDLLTGGIQFAGNNQIQNVTRRALQSATVRANAERFEPAVKLAAAFPNDGVPLSIQKRYKVDQALDMLMRTSLGDLVMAVGPIDLGGITLAGLDRVQVQKEWLPQTIREFRRSYAETLDDTRDRAIQVFETLLEDKIFKNWKTTSKRPSSYTANRSIVFEGDFQSFASHFPRRRVQTRILWEEEERKDPIIEGDVLIEFRLSIHRELEQEERRRLAEPVQLFPEEHTAIIPINLMYLRQEGVAQQIQQVLQGVWSPYDLSPLVLMSIYQMLEEKRAGSVIPKQDDQYIKSGFQPDLLDNTMRELFNAQLGAPLGSAGERIVEQTVERLLDARYGHTYKTLMSGGQWRSSLQKYNIALERLDNRYQRRGEVEYEGTKDKVADLLALSNTGLDSFMRVFESLLKLERSWPSQRLQEQGETGSVRFTLHPHEREIMQWLQNATTSRRITIGKKHYDVKCLEMSDVYEWSRERGYQDEEIEQIVLLLTKRELAEIQQQHLLCELPSQAPDIEGVATQLAEFEAELDVLLKGFPGSKNLAAMQANTTSWRQIVDTQLKAGVPEPELVYKLGQNIRLRRGELQNFAKDEQANVAKQIGTMLRSLKPVNPQHLSELEQPIEGTVSYVDQVNVLRQALLKHAQSLRSEVVRLESSLKQSLDALRREDLRYEDLVAQTQSFDMQQRHLEKSNQDVSEFEQDFQHLVAWKRLVNHGSQLYASLGQMESVTKDQADQFDQLSREIRGDISSRGIKLDILANHSIYESRLSDIERKVNEIRSNAIGVFNDRQTRYRHALTSGSGLFTREMLDQPVQYNFSNPGDSARLLEEDVQHRLVQACEKMKQRVTRYRQSVMNTLATPYLKEIPDGDRARIEDQGNGLLEDVKQLLGLLDQALAQAQDIRVIRDYPADGDGQFAVLIQELARARSALQDIDGGSQRLGNWLTQFELTPEQKQLLAHLDIDDLESAQDLIEWRNRIQCSDDDFWFNVRGLYEKRRIRLSVGRVRL